VILDNVFLTPDGYNGIVDPQQLEWLKGDLAGTRKPTLVMSHIPLMSVTSLVNGYSDKSGEWTVGQDVMTKNLSDIQRVFRENRHVKLAISGHTHRIDRIDRIDYEGVSYLCGGAVSGNWWKGPIGLFNPGYRILDLHDNGKFEEHFIEWGWKPTKVLSQSPVIGFISRVHSGRLVS
jgi:Icc protein